MATPFSQSTRLFLTKFRRRFLLFCIQLRNILANKIEETAPPMIAFGICGFINYPSFYLLWRYTDESVGSNLGLRLLAMLMCFPLIIKNHWPNRLKPWLPVYWYLTIFFCLPFLGTYLLLEHHGSSDWLMNASLALIWLILVVDWVSFTILLPLGVGLAWLLYHLTQGTVYFESHHLAAAISTYFWIIIFISVFAHNKEKLHRAKLQGMTSLSADIAHELRTPLAVIHSNMKGIQRYFPLLLKSYEIAKKHDSTLEAIRSQHLMALASSIENVNAEAISAETTISMLLMKLKPKIDEAEFVTSPIAKCVDEAIKRYPFKKDQIHKIHTDTKSDFSFLGQPLLIIHVLFNLLHNALYHIEDVGKGDISIWLEKGENFNTIYFKDTGKGIAPHELPHIFNRFYTGTKHGTGVGLAFCQSVMHSINGEIHCLSKANEWTEFQLIFPTTK